MKSSLRSRSVLFTMLACGGFLLTRSSGAFNPVSFEQRVASENTSQRSEAIQRLREQGASGLRKLQITYADDIAKHREDSSVKTPNWNLVRAALNRVSGQYDNWASGLYWHTDLEKAKSAAKSSGKPVLSLRLLGRLDEDLSCANSRFFRTALYANKEIAKTLNDNFVLHWSSERPAPIVTIDMGDGRVMKRTITGNSVHYLMDAQGRVLDALPGLYGPGAFARWLNEIQQLNTQWLVTPAEKRDTFLADYHKNQIVKAVDDYIADYEKANRITLSKQDRNAMTDSFLKTSVSKPVISKTAPAMSATSASSLAVGKSILELPILNATRLYSREPVLSIGYDFFFSPITTLHTKDAQLDESSKNLMRSKTLQRVLDVTVAKDTLDSNRTATSQLVTSRVSNQFSTQGKQTSVLESFQNALALDTIRNEYRLHVPIHKWFADGSVENFDSLNKKIYSDLFWTPKSDPWLGLAATGTYTALDNDGVTSNK